MKQRTHWTASSLDDFETCPAKYNYRYRFDEREWAKLGYTLVPSSGGHAAKDRGTEIHKTCEQYLLNQSDTLHPEISPAWASLVEGLRHFGARPEEQWEFDDGWNPHPATQETPLWLRMKIDAHYIPHSGLLHIIDFKTGKPWRASFEQVELYTIGGFAMFDDVNTVVAELWYFDSDEPYEKVTHRKQVSKLVAKWEQRAERLLAAAEFPARKNPFCKWCPFNVANGGPCKPPA